MQPKQHRHIWNLSPEHRLIISFAHIGRGGSTSLLWRLSGLSHLLLIDAYVLTHTNYTAEIRICIADHSRFLPQEYTKHWFYPLKQKVKLIAMPERITKPFVSDAQQMHAFFLTSVKNSKPSEILWLYLSV